MPPAGAGKQKARLSGPLASGGRRYLGSGCVQTA